MKKENKNIERLFQEKFKDFEVTPPDFIWDNIQEKLQPKEKKRRVIPFWFKTAGIAASFVSIVSIVFFNMDTDFKNSNSNINSNQNNNTVVNSETNSNSNKSTIRTNKFNASETNNPQNSSNSSSINKENQSKSNSLVQTESANKVSDSKFNSGTLQNSKTNPSNSGFVSNHKKQNNNTNFKKNKTSFKSSNSGIASNRNNKNKGKNNIKSNAKFNDFDSVENKASNSGITDVNSFHTFNSTKNKASNAEIGNFNSSKNKTSNSGILDINSFDASSLTSKNNTGNNSVLAENGLENLNNNSTALVAVEELKIDTITLATVTIEENPMEKLLREKETKKVADEKEKWSKWAVNSFVSPVFFNSFESGSPISDEFASNEKSFNNSTSFGVGVAYHLNKRFAIKTGVSNLNLDYDTQNIAFYSSFEDQSRIANTNIERNPNGKYIVLKHQKDVSKNSNENQLLQSSQNLGNLNQRTQYIEVPLEMSYAILNKKISLAIRGGMSTLFLTENVISISGNDGNMQIGKASNLNNVHFSSNLGLGFSYNFMKNFQLNVEPTLKYQINTFSKNAEDFSPYVVGVNTGISYKF